MSTETDITDAATGPAGPDLPTEDTPADELVLSVSAAALETVLGIRAEEDDPDGLALRVAITGISGPEYSYDLAFEEIAAVGPDHLVQRTQGLLLVFPEDTVDRLRGAELDLPRAASQGGLVIRNPNRPDPLAGIEVDLTGSVAEQVTQLLEQSINPALAAHGGFATLVGVDEDNKVYVTMGGGCQGCSVSAVTLSEGIKKSILEHIPEVADVVDATDHAAGENPFYT